MRKRSVIRQIFFMQMVFLRRGMTEERLNCLGKTQQFKGRLSMQREVQAGMFQKRSRPRHMIKAAEDVG